MPTKSKKPHPSLTVAGKLIELRRFTYSERLSEETYAYAAEIWVDGVHFCNASNEGHGGPDNYDTTKTTYTWKDVDALSEFCKANVPAEVYQGMELSSSLESVVGDIIQDLLLNREFDKLLKNKLAVVDAKGIISTYKVKLLQGSPERAAFKARVLAKEPAVRFLEDLPREEAFELFKKC